MYEPHEPRRLNPREENWPAENTAVPADEAVPAELASRAAQWVRLRPAAGALDRDRLMFLAGQASVAGAGAGAGRQARLAWLWPASTFGMTGLAAALLLMVLNPPAPREVAAGASAVDADGQGTGVRAVAGGPVRTGDGDSVAPAPNSAAPMTHDRARRGPTQLQLADALLASAAGAGDPWENAVWANDRAADGPPAPGASEAGAPVENTRAGGSEESVFFSSRSYKSLLDASGQWRRKPLRSPTQAAPNSGARL